MSSLTGFSLLSQGLEAVKLQQDAAELQFAGHSRKLLQHPQTRLRQVRFEGLHLDDQALKVVAQHRKSLDVAQPKDTAASYQGSASAMTAADTRKVPLATIRTRTEDVVLEGYWLN